MWKLWSAHGHASWESLIEPAISLAESSIVSDVLAEVLQEEQFYILNFAGLKSVFAPSGTILQAGDTLYQPALANTLRQIQRDPLSFYNGIIAQNLTRDIAAVGGIVTEADFAYYYQNGVHIREPVSTYFQGLKVFSPSFNFNFIFLFSPPPLFFSIPSIVLRRVKDNHNYVCLKF